MKLSGRSVWQVLGLYLAGGWVLLQVVDVLVDNVGLPPRVFTLALALLGVGFPIALITAVVQGSARDSGGSAEPARTPEIASARIRIPCVAVRTGVFCINSRIIVVLQFKMHTAGR